MAHFAKIDKNNVVVKVLVVPNEQEHRGQEYLNDLGLEGTWIQTSYNHNIRKRFAGVGMTYDPQNDIFIDIKPFESWVLDSNFEWIPPIDPPSDDGRYEWSEETNSWISI